MEFWRREAAVHSLSADAQVPKTHEPGPVGQILPTIAWRGIRRCADATRHSKRRGRGVPVLVLAKTHRRHPQLRGRQLNTCAATSRLLFAPLTCGILVLVALLLLAVS